MTAQQPKEYCENRVICYMVMSRKTHKGICPYDESYQKYNKCPHDTRSRPHPSTPAQINLSCLGRYERDPCIMPSCPIKVKCREYTTLLQQSQQQAGEHP